MDLFLLLLALLGHAFLWIGLVNRLHALDLRRWIIHSCTGTCFFLAGMLPLCIAAWLYVNNPDGLTIAPWRANAGGSLAKGLIAAYTVVCWAVASATLLRLLWLRRILQTPAAVRLHGRRHAKIHPRSTKFDVKETSHHPFTRLPLNETLRLDVTDWMLDVPRLAPALDGLSIVQLSDFHLTGRIGKAFFREVVRTSNELQPDLVALTGDLMESTACFDWIPDIFGQLTARYGVYFVLGNHDVLTRDVPRLRRMLEEAGPIDLGGRQRQIEINGQPVQLMGNELPWIKNRERTGTEVVVGGTPGKWETSSRQPPPSPSPSALPLRIVLAHSPDQLGWARVQDADLMLAGHTHGGQICIPPFGAIFSPSLWGVKHVGGVFCSPPTILHVTRGVGGDTPVRWNCPPEIAHIRLYAPHDKKSSATAPV
jgi:uncharacterized protein